jgi:hypothetical protein
MDVRGGSSRDLYAPGVVLHGGLKPGGDDGCMELIAIALAVGVFALEPLRG